MGTCLQRGLYYCYHKLAHSMSSLSTLDQTIIMRSRNNLGTLQQATRQILIEVIERERFIRGPAAALTMIQEFQAWIIPETNGMKDEVPAEMGYFRPERSKSMDLLLLSNSRFRRVAQMQQKAEPMKEGYRQFLKVQPKHQNDQKGKNLRLKSDPKQKASINKTTHSNQRPSKNIPSVSKKIQERKKPKRQIVLVDSPLLGSRRIPPSSKFNFFK